MVRWLIAGLLLCLVALAPQGANAQCAAGVPCWTTATRPTTLVAGLWGYNTTLGQIEWYVDSTRKWLQANAGDTFMVDSFGAVGDATTDDTVAFQNALAACNAVKGGVVKLSQKKYLIDSGHLTILQNCKLVGNTFPGDPRPYADIPDFAYTIILNKLFTIKMGDGVSGHPKGQGIQGVSIVQKDTYFAPTATLRDMINVYKGFAGTGITITANNTFPTVDHVGISGFATCVTSSNTAQVDINRVLGDCTDGIVIDNSHDTSFVRNTQIAFYATIGGKPNEVSVISAVANAAGLYRITVPNTTVAINGDIITIFDANIAILNQRWVLANRACAATCTFDLTAAPLSGANSSFGSVTTTGTTTYGVKTVSVTSAANIAIGQTVSGTGIQGGTTVAAVWLAKNLVWLSLPASANGTGVSLTFTDPAYTASSGSMVLSANIRPGGRSFVCTNSEGVHFANATAESPDIGFYFGTGCVWAHCSDCAVDSDNTVGGGPSANLVGVWFDSDASGGVWQGVMTSVGRPIINTSTGGGPHGNVVYGSEICCANNLLEHSGGTPLILSGIMYRNSANMFIADSAGPLTLSGNDFTNVGAFAQSFAALNMVEGSGTTFATGQTLYPETPQVRGSMLINGDMNVSQIIETTPNNVTGCAASPGTLTADRWRCLTVGALSPNVTSERVNLAPANFPTPHQRYSTGLSITIGAAVSPSAAQSAVLEQGIEGIELAQLGWNTNYALPVVLDFCANSSVPGTYSAYLRNNALTFSYVFTYTLPTSGFYCFSEVIPGLITAAAVGITAGTIGLRVGFDLGSGSNFQTATLNAWQGANRTSTITSPTQLINNLNANMTWTAVHLRRGTLKAAPYLPREYAAELLAAQRFYQKSFAPGTVPASNAGLTTGPTCMIAQGAAHPFAYISLRPPFMNSTYTVTTYNPAAAGADWRDVTTTATTLTRVIDTANQSMQGFLIHGSTNAAANDQACIHWTADSGN